MRMPCLCTIFPAIGILMKSHRSFLLSRIFFYNIDYPFNQINLTMRKALFLSGCLLLSQLLFAQFQYVSGSSGPIYYNLGNVGINNNNPGCPLDVNGMIHSTFMVVDAPVAGNIGAWFRGGVSGVNGNMVLQANGGNAFWFTATSGTLKIGAYGGSEPSVGMINCNFGNTVGINTTDTKGYMFAVAGSAVFTSAVVKLQSNWPDYVFTRKYRLPSLQSLATYIGSNGHLPGIPNAAEVEKKGLDLGATEAKLLEKIEELTLYTIDLQKQIDELNKKLKDHH